MVIAVREVDVGAPRRSIHDCVALGDPASRGVRSGIIAAKVGFDLDDPPAGHDPSRPAREDLAEEFGRDLPGRPGEEGLGEQARLWQRVLPRRLCARGSPLARSHSRARFSRARSVSSGWQFRILVGGEAAPARHCDPIRHEVHVRGRVRVRPQGEADAFRFSLADHRVADIETVGIRVDLKRRARRRCLGDYRVDVQVHRVSSADDPAGEVRDDVHVRVLHRDQQPSRELLAGLTHPPVDGREADVEAREDLGGVVDRPVVVDVELRALEHVSVRRPPSR